MSDEILKAFQKENGTLEDWGGNREAYHAALGAFTLGWQARDAQQANAAYCPKGHLLFSDGMCPRCERYFPLDR